MKSFIAGVAVAVVIAVCAGFVLTAVAQPAYKAFATSETRVGNPGHNLVGSNW